MEIYLPKFENTSSEKIIEQIKKGEWNNILNELCFIKENMVILNYIYFKHFATKETYPIILNFIIIQIDKVLATNNEFVVHVNIKLLNVVDIDKHKSFIQQVSEGLKKKYPQKLDKCFIHNAPFVFAQIFNMISIFIDKDTQTKITLIK